MIFLSCFRTPPIRRGWAVSSGRPDPDQTQDNRSPPTRIRHQGGRDPGGGGGVHPVDRLREHAGPGTPRLLLRLERERSGFDFRPDPSRHERKWSSSRCVVIMRRAESRSKIAPDQLKAVFEVGDFGEGVVFHGCVEYSIIDDARPRGLPLSLRARRCDADIPSNSRGCTPAPRRTWPLRREGVGERCPGRPGRPRHR